MNFALASLLNHNFIGTNIPLIQLPRGVKEFSEVAAPFTISTIMPNLVDSIQVLPPEDANEPEDIFASAPGLIFTDDTRNQHGDPGSIIVYRSARFGNIELETADPKGENERQLFGHYLWNAGIKMADLISNAEDVTWSVKGRRVLELGAGGSLCLEGTMPTV